MKRNFIYLILFLTPLLWRGAWGEAKAQTNLVLNPSFEDTILCPYSYSKIYFAINWFQPNKYYGNIINSSNSDLYNSCSSTTSDVSVPSNSLGFQNARTGNGYAGVFVYIDNTNTREYIEGTLLTPLVQGKLYCVEFYVSLADTISSIAITNMGAYFSHDSLLDSSSYNAITIVTPQVENSNTNYLTSKTTWMLVSGTFTAAGGERFITIGNFHSPATTNEITVTGGWSGNGSYYYIDDVSVIDCDSIAGVEEMAEENISLSPNPATNEIMLTANQPLKTIHIYNVLGEMVLERTANSEKVIDVSTWKAGVYFVEVETEKGVVRKTVIKE